MIPISNAVICWKAAYHPAPKSTRVSVVRHAVGDDVGFETDALDEKWNCHHNTYGACDGDWAAASDEQRLVFMREVFINLTTVEGIDPVACRFAFETVIEWRKAHPAIETGLLSKYQALRDGWYSH